MNAIFKRRAVREYTNEKIDEEKTEVEIAKGVIITVSRYAISEVL